MTYRCSECDVNWWPYQTDHGRCAMCGTATVRTQDLVSDDADLLYRIARAEAEKREIYANFERYYAEREQHWPAA